MNVPFEVITKRKAAEMKAPRRARKSWVDLINVLTSGANSGKAVFVSDEHLTEADMKYLPVALKRRGKGEHLRSQREQRDGVVGRLLWVVIHDGGA